MTSKEALTILKEEKIYLSNANTNEVLNAIAKDLEVLEILKKYYKSDGWSNGGMIEFWKMKGKELAKIREWLEND